MPGLRDHFAHFYPHDDDAIATAIRTGLVTPDTNVLLSLYRFQAWARDECFGVLEKLGDRLWIPYQVGLEFHRNRLNVMHGQQEFFSKSEQDFNAAFEDLREKVRTFRARMAITETQVGQVEDAIRDLQDLLGNVMNWASDGSLYMSDHASDTILAQIEALLGNRVGGLMEPRELEDARKEAKRRADAGIPPGYKDKNKPDPTGDYLVWRQLMNEAKERKLPVVFITDDRKEDWYRREHGLTLGARYELREEMMAEAGVPLLIMTTETFLHHAEKYLNAEVSDETIAQARELRNRLIHIRPMGEGGGKVLLSLEAANREIAQAVGSLDPHQAEGLASVAALMLARDVTHDAEAVRKSLAYFLRPPSPYESQGEKAARFLATLLASDYPTEQDALLARSWLLQFLQQHGLESPGDQDQPEG